MTGLTFLNPLLLLALAALPLIWFILRVTPPGPKRLVLPTAQFLFGLEKEDQTPARTPWWLILLRLLIFTLLVIGLARPVLNPKPLLENTQSLLIILDNGWSSSASWSSQKNAALEVLSKARAHNSAVQIVMTAPEPGKKQIYISEMLGHNQAEAILSGAQIRPWASDYTQVLKQMRQFGQDAPSFIYFFSDGLGKKGVEPLLSFLSDLGAVTVYLPEPEQTARVIRPATDSDKGSATNRSSFSIISAALPDKWTHKNVLNLYNKEGELIKHIERNFSDTSTSITKAGISLPSEILNKTSHLKLGRTPGAGGTYYLAQKYHIRNVGIVSTRQGEDTTPYVEAQYYLKRALDPSVNVVMAPLSQLLNAGVSSIIVPDIASMPSETQQELNKWVEKGGWLIYFAGPNIAKTTPVLSPVDLREGGRALEGIMTWEEPLKIGGFAKSSPFYDIEVPEDVEIKQMVLAQPSPDLEDKIWAYLKDGTPLMTSHSVKKGQVVLIHTSASPKWSNLPMSGMYVKILERMAKLAGTSYRPEQAGNGFYRPKMIVNGQGVLKPAPTYVKGIPAKDFDTTIPNSYTPPGLYERSGFVKALNIGDRITSLGLMESFPAGVKSRLYERTTETHLMAIILFIAFILMLLDWGIRIVMGSRFEIKNYFSGRGSQIKATIALTLSLSFLCAFQAKAQDVQKQIEYAGQTYLAYIQTPSERVNRKARIGLENLAEILKRRTSVEPAGVAGINLKRDEIVFFPLIYWPVTPNAPVLGPAEAKKVQKYMDNGGMILFDTMDQYKKLQALEGVVDTENAESLKKILQPINVPPLTRIPENHVLTKSFYLLDGFSGEYSGGQLWVEKASADPETRTGLDGVTRILIGSNDWGAAWASGQYDQAATSFDERRQEMSYRFGVNLVMYALTGNYKSDQVHVPFILERLGQ